MKFLKLFFVLVLSAVAFNMNAMTKATITITSDAHPSYYDYIEIEMDATYPADFSVSSKKLHNPMTGGAVEVYAVGTTDDYCIVKMNDVNGVKIVFKANVADDNYTMSFSGLEGDPIQVKKGAEGVPFGMDESYQFECTHSTSCEFYLVTAQEPDAYTRDVTGGQWGTICYPAAITEVQGGVLYELTGKTETQVYAQEVDLSGDNTTVAGKPYVFKANDDATQLVMPYTAGTEALNPVTATGLVGTFYGLEGVPAGAYGILNNVVVEIAEGNPLLANRAYIKLENLPDANKVSVPGRAIFMIQNATTGLEGATVNGLQNGTYMVNGQLVIVKDGKTFNVLGL